MSELTTKCAIWPNFKAIEHPSSDPRLNTYLTSDRAGGNYAIPSAFDGYPQILDDQGKARLTTWLVDQRNQGNNYPLVTKTVIEYVKSKEPLPLSVRAERLLKYLTRMTDTAGKDVNLSYSGNPIQGISGPLPTNPMLLSALAWSESVWVDTAHASIDLQYLIEYLKEEDWIRMRGDSFYYVTVKGHQKVADARINTDSFQAFVAMWLNESMNEVYNTGVKPGIKDAGYRPFRVDLKEHVNKIDDEIIAELRRSRFVVADFTHGEDGARGSVYYEAGFAHGLGIKVIFACRQDAVQSLHFDTNHYNHIVWTDSANLREQLKKRILAVIGEGPGLNTIP